jgi:hypothetical protein
MFIKVFLMFRLDVVVVCSFSAGVFLWGSSLPGHIGRAVYGTKSLGLWFRISLEAWMSVRIFLFVFLCAGSGLARG